MRTMLSVAAAGMLVSAAALAQNATSTAAPSSTSPSATDTANGATNSNAPAGKTAMAARKLSLRQEMKKNLQKAGFSNITVMPDSYLVRARDQAGNPVTMFVSSDSVTEVVAENSQDGSNSGTGSTSGTQTASTDSQNSTGNAADETAQASFVAVPASQPLSSNVVGLDVYNDSNQDIGTIKDIAYGNSGVKAYILGVGGFLGMGDHYVAVKPSAVSVSYDENGKKWQAKMDTTAAQLKAAPEYKYPNAS